MADAPKSQPGSWTSYKFTQSWIVPHGKTKLDPKDFPKFESTEPVTGYRVWKLERETMTLKSCTQFVHWPFREKLTRGAQGGGVLGIHAAKSERDIFYENLGNGPIFFESHGLWSDYKADVAGEVSMWGETTEHEHGYLSEFAYPKTLWMPESTDPITVMQLEENYGVPVILRPDLGPWKQTATDILFSNSNWVASALLQTPFIYPTLTKDDKEKT